MAAPTGGERPGWYAHSSQAAGYRQTHDDDDLVDKPNRFRGVCRSRRLSQISAVDVARVANKAEPQHGGGLFRCVCSRRECSYDSRSLGTLPGSRDEPASASATAQPHGGHAAAAAMDDAGRDARQPHGAPGPPVVAGALRAARRVDGAIRSTSFSVTRLRCSGGMRKGQFTCRG